jgi:hypothetical protein
MSQEQDKTKPTEVPESEGLHLEPPPFEQGFHPESLPKITVPDLPEDAEGLSAEALAQVPTLTELVAAPAEDVEVNTEEPSSDSESPDESQVTEAESVEESIQAAPVQADTWTEIMHARMGKLTDEIHTLNARLDRLEALNKTEV